MNTRTELGRLRRTCMQRKVLRSGILTCALACASITGSQAQTKPASNGASTKSADAERYPCRDVHTFDFWVGSFEATPWNKPDAKPTGQLRNTREYEGCVIVERWTSVNGSAGMSMAFFDNNRKVWRMVWNSDSNQSNDFEGTYTDGAMRFNGWVLDKNGKRVLASNVLENVSPDVIRHIYSISEDDGKSWIVVSDGRFVRLHGAEEKQ